MAFTKLSALLLSSCFISQVYSTPVATTPEELAARGLSTCQVVSDIVKILHNPTISASATKFCSSFISIPLQTATIASTATVTPAAATTTTTVTVSTDITITTTLGLPQTTGAPVKKRGGSLPPYVAAFASSKISQACSCLSITPSTTTVRNTATITAPVSTSTETTTVTSTSTSTSTVLGAAPECLPSAITASPVRLFQPGEEAIAGTAQEVRSRFPINSLQDCCSACYLDTPSCVAFTYGNYDNSQLTPGRGSLDQPSTVNTCRIYRDVFDDCANDVALFDTRVPLLAGEVNNVGIGPCTPDLS